MNPFHRRDAVQPLGVNEFAGVIGSRVVHQLGMRNRFENAALFEDGDGFGELAGHIKVVGDGDNAHSDSAHDS